MNLRPFKRAAWLMKKYNSDNWESENCPCPIISKEHYLQLRPDEHPLAEFFMAEFEEVKNHPYKTPKVRELLQALIRYEGY